MLVFVLSLYLYYPCICIMGQCSQVNRQLQRAEMSFWLSMQSLDNNVDANENCRMKYEIPILALKMG